MPKEQSAGIIAYYFDNTTKQFKFLVGHSEDFAKTSIYKRVVAEN